MTNILLSLILFLIVGLIVFLFFYIIKQKNKEKTFNYDSPEYLKIVNELDKEKYKSSNKQDYIDNLKKDKDQLMSNKEDIDEFKEISNRSFNEYQSVVSEYRNFHEKLTGDVKYQGKFNEITLRRILEKHGLKEEDKDFEIGKEKEITDSKTDQTKKIKPDFILNLEGGQKIIIDCKVSLKAFEDFVNSKDKEERKINMRKHIESVKKHINDISNKDYKKLYGLQNFKYVVMFMPFDACYLSALEGENDDLYNLCFEKNIILAGPISIMSLISTATSLKNEKKRDELVSKIVTDATSIYDKYVVLKDSLIKSVNSHTAHTNSLREVIRAAYGGSQSLEKKLIKLKKERGLDQTKNLKIINDSDNELNTIDDNEKRKDINLQ